MHMCMIEVLVQIKAYKAYLSAAAALFVLHPESADARRHDNLLMVWLSGTGHSMPAPSQALL